MVKSGYKQTEIGVIPEDWEVNELGNIGNVNTGMTPATNNRNFYGEEYYFVSPSDLGKGKYILNSEKKLSKLGFSIARKYPKNSILFTCIGSTIGKAGISLFELTSNQQINAVLPNDLYSSDFVYYFLTFISPKIKLGASEQAVPMINKTEFSKTQIPLPPLPEQQAIAEALSDADDWIESLEQLIAKKRVLKQGAMQELLTPKEDWEESTIFSITDNIIDYRGVTPKKLGMEWGNGNIVALSAGNVKRGYIDFNSECYLGSQDLYKRWMRNGNPKKDDIVFTLEAPLGNIALIPDNKKYIMSQRTILLQLNKKFDSMFIFQLLFSKAFQDYILESATGSTAQGIKRQTFEKLLVKFPKSLVEQTRIATILSDMDLEIAALEQQLEKARQIKQGMMQELLTGRIRLI
ncbi:restriction endonuclease subunit S [Flavobacterium sp. PL12]|uniref:restriction endonuclease subunit S n=1 Tax=Flavobacterium sp. PL12 TaxID=3071718 RepID=UPI00319EB784